VTKERNGENKESWWVYLGGWGAEEGRRLRPDRHLHITRPIFDGLHMMSGSHLKRKATPRHAQLLTQQEADVWAFWQRHVPVGSAVSSFMRRG